MNNKKIAYFTAEVGLNPEMKTYSGGLGILAGDTIKAMADLRIPFCAVTLLYKKGFMKQEIVDNYQTEHDDEWDFMSMLEDIGCETKVNIRGEDVFIKIWRYEYEGVSGYKVPIYYLDTDIEKNPSWAQEITNRLYQGDRLFQEIVLGVGGVRALRCLGHDNIERYHMNEGHSSFLTLELYREIGEEHGWDEYLVREKCIFTTHTPVAAGHDKFDYPRIYDAIRDNTKLIPWHIEKLAGQGRLNTTKLAMSFSNHVNAVSKKHCEVTKQMFPDYDIHHITNGIHSASWACSHMQELFDKYIPGWKEDYSKLEGVFAIPNSELLNAHKLAKNELIEFVNKNNVTGVTLTESALTMGFARRFVEYKEADFIFKNMDDLRRLGDKVQFIFAGKSHANDGIGKSIMKKVIEYAKELKLDVSIAFVEDYNIDIGKKLVAGCDLWLNMPIPFNEASGTSGMKAAVNGCLHFSTLDGWAIESFEHNGGGFPIYQYEDFMQMLRYKILPKFECSISEIWANEMKLAIGNAASWFNTHRMCKEYIELAYKMDYNELRED